MTARQVSRRGLLLGSAAGVVGVATLGGCGRTGEAVGPSSPDVRRAEAARRGSGQRAVTTALAAKATTIDLGGQTVQTWAYGDSIPGPLIRATAGDLLRVRVDNALPTETSVHWHGIALRNDMDGVPGVTQKPIGEGASFTYEFTVPDPGTYFYHPHTGVQLDRGLHGVLVVDDPSEPGDYDKEWVIVLDDWVDGTGQTPDDVLAELTSSGGDSHGSMMMDGSMGMGGMGEGMNSPLLGGAGDVSYPYYLVNGRLPTEPDVLDARAGQRIRLRIVNAGSDTAFRVALGEHTLTVTHSDGFPVRPVTTDALLVGMGERFDVVVTVADGVFPLVASPEGKNGTALAVVRTAPGALPAQSSRPVELQGRVLVGSQLTAVDDVRLATKSVDRTHELVLAGRMAPYRWTINGKTFDDAEPLPVEAGERVRLRFSNMSMMFHPMHVHGHTFGLLEGGARKDTVIVRPMETVTVDLEADNPGQWAAHCHNVYHAESGMMTVLSYRA